MPQSSLDALPPYLRRYCVTQDCSKYTSRDHASWRYIMRQSRDFFRDNAVPIYLDGLRKTAIPLDRIPKVSEMDQAQLKKSSIAGRQFQRQFILGAV